MFLCAAVCSCGPVPRPASAPRPCAGDEAPFLFPGAESSPRHFVEVAHSALRSDPLGDTVGEREFSLLLSTEQSTFECSCCLCTGLRSSLAVLNFHETTDISACGGGGKLLASKLFHHRRFTAHYTNTIKRNCRKINTSDDTPHHTFTRSFFQLNTRNSFKIRK